MKMFTLTWTVFFLHILNTSCQFIAIPQIHPFHFHSPQSSLDSHLTQYRLYYYNNLNWFPHTYQTFILLIYPLPSTTQLSKNPDQYNIISQLKNF